MPTNRTRCLMQLWSPAHLKECYEHTHLTQGETKIQIYPQFSIWFLACHTTWDSQGLWFPRKQKKASEQLHPVAHSQLFSSATHHTDAALLSETDREAQCRKAKSGFSNKHQVYGWLPCSFITHVFPSFKSRGLFTTSSGACWGQSPSALWLPCLLVKVQGAESRGFFHTNSHKQCCPDPLSVQWCLYELSKLLGSEQ